MGMETEKFAIEIVLMLPELVKAGIDIYQILNEAADKIRRAQAENRDITVEDWVDMNQKISGLRAQRDQALADLTNGDQPNPP